MLNFTAGITALWANQAALNTVANNIANAGTPDYHRQVALFSDRPPVQHRDLLIGTGVDVDRIRRIRSDVLEESLTRNVSELSDIGRRLDTIRQVESLLLPGAGSLHDRLQGFFNELELLSAAPLDATRRGLVLDRAVALTQEMRSLANSLERLQQELRSEAQQTVDQINLRAEEVAELNDRIRVAQGRGFVPNDLLDRRDQLTNELAEMLDVRVEQQGPGQTVVLFGVGSMLVGHHAVPIDLRQDEAGKLVVSHPGFDEPIPLGGGKLAGLIEAHNQLLPQLQQELEQFASAFVSGIDARHATAIGLDGPFQVLLGRRSVADTGAPLAVADTAFPIQAGSLFITVTDTATGARTLAEINMDPASNSLQDVAALISGIDHIQAVVEVQSGTLQIMADTGYAFDFTGRPQTNPDAAGITGTAVPQIHGLYSGASNDQFVFQFTGSGTVGVTDGLALEVRDGVGQLITTLDVGLGYEPDSLLLVAEGISLSVASGTVNAGDSFTSQVVAMSDTVGILTALGLNTLFVGKSLADIRVNSEILDDPRRFATSVTGQAGDSAGLVHLLAARDELLLDGGTRTFEQYLADLIADVGSEVNTLSQLQDHGSLLGQQLRAQRDSLSGVDPNEELVNMLRFQRSFQAAARYIATIDETLEELFTILR